jgi:hypothetical protein
MSDLLGVHLLDSAAGGSTMCRWPCKLLSTIFDGASPARGTRRRHCGRLPCRQYRLETRHRSLVAVTLLRRHDDVQTVGLVDAVDQGRKVPTELCRMAGHRTDVRCLGRHHSGNAERSGCQQILHQAT